MASVSLKATGFLSDATAYTGGAIAVDGDTLDLAGFDLYVDKSYATTGLTLANTGGADCHVIPASGNINLKITAFGTLTHKIIVQGSPNRVINNTGSPSGYAAEGSA